jgi:hypothetical protein
MWHMIEFWVAKAVVEIGILLVAFLGLAFLAWITRKSTQMTQKEATG